MGSTVIPPVANDDFGHASGSARAIKSKYVDDKLE